MRKEELVDGLRRLSLTERREVLSEFAEKAAGPEAPRVFLSYSRDDTPFVRDLAAGLERGGVRIWFDVRELTIGEDYLIATAKALRECDFCVLVVSPYSMSSAEVVRELVIARDVGTAIIPLLMQDAALVEEASNLQWIDFRSHFEIPLAALIARLHGRFDNALTEQRLNSATKPLLVNRGFIPLFQKNNPASSHWFSALVVASAFAIYSEGAIFLSAQVFVAFGLLLLFTVLLLITAYRVAGRRETLAAVRSSLWTYFFSVALWSVLLPPLTPPGTHRFIWWCAVPAELAMMAAMLIVEFSPGFRRRLRARPERTEVFPRWLRLRKRMPKQAASS